MKVRPSELVEVDGTDPIAVYCFDRAVNTFGDALMHEIKSVDAKTKQESETKTRSILTRWLPEASRAGSFRDPAKRSG